MKDIEKYIEIWEVGMTTNESYAQAMTCYVDYSKCILEELKKPIPSQLATLIEIFWHATYCRRHHATIGIDTVIGEKDRTPEDEEKVDYCERVEDKYDLVFNPWRDPSGRFCSCEAR